MRLRQAITGLALLALAVGCTPYSEKQRARDRAMYSRLDREGSSTERWRYAPVRWSAQERRWIETEEIRSR